MGSANSKVDKSQALNLCKARKRFIKQAIDSRYALAAAHLSYTQSLRCLGIALRRYAEAEVLIESSLSTSATELEKTLSNSSFPSPSPSHLVGVSDSPLYSGGSPLSPTMARLSYMAIGCTAPMTVTVNPMARSFVEDDYFSVLPPPPPPPESELGGSWDFFNPCDDDKESFRFMGNGGSDVNLEDLSGWSQFKLLKLDSRGDNLEASGGATASCVLAIEDAKPIGKREGASNCERNASVKSEMLGPEREKPIEEKDLCDEREDPSEFITHRAKDFLSSIKDMEHKFFRASESGKEVSRMLEANKIRVGFSEVKGQPSSSTIMSACQLVCCSRKPTLISHESGQAGSKIIIWKRSTSSTSSSSRNPLARASKDDASNSGSDFVDDFCMIAGSNLSSLERLYAWERKLFDEVKASESIRKVYDRKCNQLRHQFAKGYGNQVIDRTRAVVKDLHSRIIVALHSVDSISKRIEKIRDEELQPQLVELVHGFIRMWKAMLECHHAQYITISLAYHSKSPSGGTPQGESRRQIMAQLKHEIECFGLSFRDWVNSLESYIEFLNGWLHNCILHPPEKAKNRRPWSPRRVLAPPIFVLFRDWVAGLKDLESDEVNDSIESFLSDLHDLMEEEEEQGGDQTLKRRHQAEDDSEGGVELGKKKENEENECAPSNLSCIHASLTKVLDRLTKFSEASLKMYEDVRQKSDAALSAYSNCRPLRSKTL